MTAREELINALCNGRARCGVENEPGFFRRRGTEVVDAFVREHAKKQRLYYAARSVNFDRHPDHLIGYAAVDDYVSDLIDPEVL